MYNCAQFTNIFMSMSFILMWQFCMFACLHMLQVLAAMLGVVTAQCCTKNAFLAHTQKKETNLSNNFGF